MSRKIIIFQKNRLPGQVKTRLAKTIGDEKALEIYDFMVKNIHACIEPLGFDTSVYFSHFDEKNVLWDYASTSIQTQDPDLGIRMYDAIKHELEKGYTNVILIGTDFIDFQKELIEDAFNKLDQNDYVFGPTYDGGYYLVGCKKVHSEVFLDKIWSTETVLIEAIDELEKLKLTVGFTEKINDIDTEEDLGKWRSFFLQN
ncbi:MAG: TIGR04282 family arsenosugar biosynthesis glycosyltransferase [Fluviicola sp.]